MSDDNRQEPDKDKGSANTMPTYPKDVIYMDNRSTSDPVYISSPYISMGCLMPGPNVSSTRSGR